MRPNKKKLFCFLTATALFLMPGCKGMPENQFLSLPTASPENATASPQSTEGSQKITEINLYQYKPEYNDAVDKAATEFSKENEEIEIKVKSARDGEDYMTTLKTLINSGDMPHIFNLGRLSDFNEFKDKLMDLSDLELTQFAMEASLNGAAIGDKIYGVPYFIEGFGFVYNRELFEKASIDVGAIDNFMAFESAVEELDRMKETLKIEAVFAFPAKDFQITGLHMSNVFISAEFGGDIVKAYQSKNLEFKYAEALKKMIDLQMEYSVKPVKDIDSRKMVEEYFIGKKVAIIQQGNWIHHTIETIDKDFADKIDMLPYPIEGLRECCNSAGVPMYWVISDTADEKVREGARSFLNWLYLSENGKKIIEEDFMFIPAYRGFAADTVKDPLGKRILAQYSARNIIPYVFPSYPDDWGINRFGADIYRYANGELAWDEVVSNAREAWNKLRQQ